MATFCVLNSFNAGELSDKMLARSDVSQYVKGCRTLQNFLVTPYGSVERRPGTFFVAQAKTASVRLLPFVVSSDMAYVCEFGDRYVRFYQDSVLVTEAVSPYTIAELAEVKAVQSADVMFLVHPAHPIYELKRQKSDQFSVTELTFDYPPVLEPNLVDALTLKPSALEGEITLTASLPADYRGEDVFTAGNVGGFFELIHTRRENSVSKDFRGNGASASLEVFGYWSLTSHGTWTGELLLQRSFDQGLTWSDFRSYSSAKDSNISTSGEEKAERVLYRVLMSDYAQSSTGTLQLCRVLLSNPDFVTTGVVKITAVTDATHAAGHVVKKLGSLEATQEWNEGAWSKRRGFPRTVSFFEERLLLGGNTFRPQTVWGSKTNAWNDFLLGDNDDQALEFTMASDTVNTICWMCQHDALVIGTLDSEWTLSASSSDAALTPSNVKVKRQSVYGSNGIPARMVGDVILFVQRQGRKVREFVYSMEKDGYVSPDLTILADHITASGIRETALQQQPDTILWCLLNDGTLAAVTYERDQEVCGWHRYVTDGFIRSLTVLPGSAEDIVYLAVERNGKTMIERFALRNWQDVTHCCFLDSAVTTQSTTPMSSGTGLTHLAGKTVHVLADGAVQTEKVVSPAGEITLDEPATVVTAGLGYESILAPMPLEIETQNGLSMLRRKNICEVRVRVYRSIGGKIRAGDDAFQDIISREVLLDDVNAAITPKSEVVQIQTRSGYSTAPVIEIKQDLPLPLNVAAIMAIYEVCE